MRPSCSLPSVLFHQPLPTQDSHYVFSLKGQGMVSGWPRENGALRQGELMSVGKHQITTGTNAPHPAPIPRLPWRKWAQS